MSASLVDLKNNETSAMEGVSIVWALKFSSQQAG
jgi:hypothetical protein